MHNPGLRLVVIFGVISLLCNELSGQPRTSAIVNFNLQDFGGGSQNWGIDSKDNFVYVANNAGLFEFDGRHWRLYQLPNKTIIRSVKICGNRIYTGSYEEFGYWKRSENGTLEYSSLSFTINSSSIESQFVWSIHEIGSKVIFKTFNAVYVYDGTSTETYNLGGTLLADAIIDDHYFVYVYGQGLHKLEQGKFTNLGEISKPENVKIKAILPHSKGSISLISERQGGFEYSSGQFRNWPMSIDQELKTNQFNDILVSGHIMYLGTVKNGVYLYNTSTKSWSNVSTKNGLSDNTILASVEDDYGNIWFALDNGVSALPKNSHTISLNTSNQDIGVVHDVALWNESIYAATNTGVYVFENENVQFVDGTQGLTWSITEANGDLIYGHNSGTYSINKKGIHSKISHDNGGYEFVENPFEPGTFIQCNYAGITKYEKVDGSWRSQRIKGILAPIKQIVFEAPRVAWVAHAYKGLQRITFDENYENILNIEDHYISDIPNIYDIRLYQCFNQISVYSAEKWFKYNPLKDHLEPFTQLTDFLQQDSLAYAITPFSDQPVMLRTPDERLIIRSGVPGQEFRIDLSNRLYRNKLLRGEGMQKAKVYDSIIYVGLDNDVMLVDASSIFKLQSPQHIDNINLLVNNQPITFDKEIQLRQTDKLRIELGSKLLSNESFQYRVLPKESNWIGFEGDLELEFLAAGRSEIELRTVNVLGAYSDKISILINKKPSWVFGWKGLLLLVLFLVGIISIIRIINNFILIRHKKYLDEKYEHEQQLRQKELMIRQERHENDLLKRQHELELQAKRKELANSAMAMVKKNELLQEMKSEIIGLKGELSDKASVNKIVSHIDRNLHKEKDWEVFESNFNKIHDSFFQNLLKNHDAKLSPKDLRLSAYLKMNLSSKEIAPLMGISVRGVEIHRYRLRKKLSLSSDQNLSEYLNAMDSE